MDKKELREKFAALPPESQQKVLRVTAQRIRVRQQLDKKFGLKNGQIPPLTRK